MPGAAASVTYEREIRPLIEARCVTCHRTGGSTPFPLESWDEVALQKELVVRAVEERRMPSRWLADDTNCAPLRDDQRLSDSQVALFTSWAAAGFPRGDVADYKPLAEPRMRDLGEPSLTATMTAAHPLKAGEEYFCAVTDTVIGEDTWVTAMQFVPEHGEYVRQAIATASTGMCDNLGLSPIDFFTYWPRAPALAFEPGSARLLRGGTRIAIQLHYDTTREPAGQVLPADSSQLRLWTLPAGEKPQYAIERMVQQTSTISIPVGAVDLTVSGEQAVAPDHARSGAEIIGVSPHMRYLGQRYRQTLRDESGTTTCLLDLPSWDPSWSLDYMFDPSAYVPIRPEQRLGQTCVYSNRTQDQPLGPDGNPLLPQLTSNGDTMRHEQCLGYVWIRYPL
jgi:hypothetical protein